RRRPKDRADAGYPPGPAGVRWLWGRIAARLEMRRSRTMYRRTKNRSGPAGARGAALALGAALVLTAAGPGLAPSPAAAQAPSPTAVPPEVVANAAAWPLANKDYANTRAVAGGTVTAGSVARLGVAWSAPITGAADYGAAATNPL